MSVSKAYTQTDNRLSLVDSEIKIVVLLSKTYKLKNPIQSKWADVNDRKLKIPPS